jgi:pimeloyl-ACP methyl ester carboxylesterase
MKNIKFFGLLCLSTILALGFLSPAYSGSATAALQNRTLMQPQGKQDMETNATNIVLVHGLWAYGSSWSKVIPILKNAGHRVIVVQLAAHSLADDVKVNKDYDGGDDISD